MLSNEDIFYIKGVHEIIISYKRDLDEVIRKKVTRRRHKSLLKHVDRMRNYYNKCDNYHNSERIRRRQLNIDF